MTEKPRVDTALACPKCGSVEWEMEADTEESVTYQVDFERHAFAETQRETDKMDPTDWICLACHEFADEKTLLALNNEFIGEASGRAWRSIEEDEWSTFEPDEEERPHQTEMEYDGPHEACGVNMPHTHVL